MGQNKQTGHVHVAHRVLCTFEHIFSVVLLQSQKEIHCYLAVSTFISWSRLRLRYVSLSCRIFSKMYIYLLKITCFLSTEYTRMTHAKTTATSMSGPQ